MLKDFFESLDWSTQQSKQCMENNITGNGNKKQEAHTPQEGKTFSMGNPNRKKTINANWSNKQAV